MLQRCRISSPHVGARRPSGAFNEGHGSSLPFGPVVVAVTWPAPRSTVRVALAPFGPVTAP